MPPAMYQGEGNNKGISQFKSQPIPNAAIKASGGQAIIQGEFLDCSAIILKFTPAAALNHAYPYPQIRSSWRFGGIISLKAFCHSLIHHVLFRQSLKSAATKIRAFTVSPCAQKKFKKPLAIVFSSDKFSAPFPLKGMDSMFADR